MEDRTMTKKRKGDDEDVEAFFDDLVTPDVQELKKRSPRESETKPPERLEEEPKNEKAGWPYFWPPGKAMPSRYARQEALPCPACRRVHLDTLSRAVACMATQPSPAPGMAYFRCRACEHRWKLLMYSFP